MAQRYATDAELLTYAPDAASDDATLRAYALDRAKRFINLERWGDTASYGHLALAAHFLALHPSSSVTGGSPQVTSRSAAGVSISYATATSEDSEFGSTSWGRDYLELRDSIVVVGIVAEGIGVVL